MRLLLTNDDGKASPLLPFAIEAVRSFGDLEVVVPVEEQSWKGKSMSRFDWLKAEHAEIEGVKLHCVSGTPADCTNLAIYHLCEKGLDLVISGINIGINSGLGFTMASGTLGACFEANIAGLPAIAFSQELGDNVWAYYLEHRGLPEEDAAPIHERCVSLVRRVLKVFVNNPSLLKGGISWSVNFPIAANMDTPMVVCSLGDSLYGSCFSKVDGFFRHDLKKKDVFIDDGPNTDFCALKQGSITITPIDIKALGKVSEVTRKNLQSHFV